jgi:hypothetical protein
MSKKQIVVASVIVLILALLAVGLAVLLRDEPDIPPAPLVDTRAPDAEVFELEAGEQDAEVDVGEEAGPTGKGPGKTDPRVSRLIACCRVVANNAKSVADPMMKASMLQAASVCEASARTGQFDAVDGILKKYDVPCQ